jgi:hypothetical protein
VFEALSTLIDGLSKCLQTHLERIKKGAFEPGHRHSPKLFELAREYCVLHSAAVCVEMWVWNRETLGEFFGEGKWLVLALQKMLGEFGLFADFEPVNRYSEDVTQEMLRQLNCNQLFSIVQMKLA